jgi:hypothetical protein
MLGGGKSSTMTLIPPPYRMLPFVRFGLIDAHALTKLEKHVLLKGNETFNLMLYEAYKFKSNPKAHLTNLRTEPRRGHSFIHLIGLLICTDDEVNA